MELLRYFIYFVLCAGRLLTLSHQSQNTLRWIYFGYLYGGRGASRYANLLDFSRFTFGINNCALYGVCVSLSLFDDLQKTGEVRIPFNSHSVTILLELTEEDVFSC